VCTLYQDCTLTSVRSQNDFKVPRKLIDITNISISTENRISKSVYYSRNAYRWCAVIRCRRIPTESIGIPAMDIGLDIIRIRRNTNNRGTEREKKTETKRTSKKTQHARQAHIRTGISFCNLSYSFNLFFIYFMYLNLHYCMYLLLSDR